MSFRSLLLASVAAALASCAGCETDPDPAAPVIATTALPDAYAGEAYAHTLLATGGEAPLRFEVTGGALPANLTLSLEGALAGTPTGVDTAVFTVTVTDANGRTSAPVDLSLRVYAVPQVDVTPLADGYVGESYAASLGVSGGKAPYTFTHGSLPAGLAVSTAGAVTGTPAQTGAQPFSVTVTDANGRTSAPADVSLTVYALPAITSSELADAYEGRTYSATVSALGGKTPLTFSATGVPMGLEVLATGEVRGQTIVTGTHGVHLTVTDANGRVGSADVDLTVHALPSLTSARLPDGYASATYSAQLEATGGKAPLTFSSGALPPGLAVSSAGAVSGTPSTEGAYQVFITVTDANDVAAPATPIALDVYALPAVATVSLPDAYLGEAYAQTIDASGGKPPYTFSPGSLPAGLLLASSGGLTGTPTVAGNGSVNVVVRDVNDRASPQAAIPLSVLTPPSITSATLPDGSVGSHFSFGLQASGGRAPYTWERVSGAFATGLTLEGSTLSGTPTAAGSFQVTVRVTDANGRTASKTFDHVVGDATVYGEVYAIAGWNIEWFGSTGLGPTDEALQRQNAAGVITDAGFAIWGVAEIAETTAFTGLMTDLPQYRGFVARHLPGGSTYYSTTEQQVGVIYDPMRVTVRDAGLILTEYGNGGAQDYFAGRPPLRVDFTADGGGGDLSVVVLHMKANTGSETEQYNSYLRRMDAGTKLKEYLDTTMPSDRVLVVGDWNDDVDVSIWDESSDTPYRQLISDSANYRFVTDVLTDAGLRSTPSYPNVIDHHLATSELLTSWVQPSEIVRPDLWTTPVAGYSSTTSDHYPVVSRYVLGGPLGPDGGTPDGGTPDGGSAEPSGAVFLNEIRYDEPLSNVAQEFIELRNGDLVTLDLEGWTLSDGFGVRHVFAAGTNLAPGEVIVVFGGASGIPAGISNAVTASSGALGLNNSSADTVTLRDAQGTTIDATGWTTTVGDGVSINRSPDGDLAGTWVTHTTLNAGLGASPGTRASGAAW